MEKNHKNTPKAPWFFLLSLCLFAGTLSLFSFRFAAEAATPANTSKREIQLATDLVQEQLLAKLADPLYNFSNMRRNMMSRSSTGSLSYEYHYTFILNEEPLCHANRAEKIICGRLSTKRFTTQEENLFPISVHLKDKKVLLFWQGQRYAPQDWLPLWSQHVQAQKERQVRPFNHRIIEEEKSTPEMGL